MEIRGSGDGISRAPGDKLTQVSNAVVAWLEFRGAA